MPRSENESPRPKDKWDKADILIKGLGVALISGAITIYGIYNNSSRERESELNRKSQLFVQTMSGREASESDLRAKMFQYLMDHYFVKKDPEAQILFLRLIALNFQEYLSLKPLFEHIDHSFSDSSHKVEVRKLAREIVNRQISELEGSGGEVLRPPWLEEGKPVSCGPLELTVLEVNEDKIRLRTLPEDENGFEVSFYDMPYTDNSVVNAMRYSIVLSAVKPAENKAGVKIVFFPENYVSPRDRPRMDRLIADLLNSEQMSLSRK